MTNATCGLRGFLLSESASLQSSLESKLKRRLDGAGSMLFSLTWKAKATPAGRPYCQLAASALRTSGDDFGSWQTPKVATGKYQYSNGDHNAKFLNLEGQAELAVWPTPMAGTPAQKGYNEAGNTDSGRKTVKLAAWATPTTRDFKSESATDEFNEKRWGHSRGKPLSAQAAAWSTPRANKWGFPDAHGSQETPLTDSGETPNGLPAQTEKRGQLDPDHSRWVMGYSAAHLSCAPTAMQLSPKRPKRSSKR